MRVKDKYLNPFTDFGFKKLFGVEPNKDILIDFLNELLRKDEGKIKDITYPFAGTARENWREDSHLRHLLRKRARRKVHRR